MENYATRDFYLASYLIDKGENYTNVYLVNQNTTEFTFEQSEKLHEYVESFYTQKALVNPMSYGLWATAQHQHNPTLPHKKKQLVSIIIMIYF